MAKIILIGANHKTAPVALREKLSFSSEETIAALEILKQDKDIKESLIFSTCNRTEILYIPEKGDQVDKIIEFISLRFYTYLKKVTRLIKSLSLFHAKKKLIFLNLKALYMFIRKMKLSCICLKLHQAWIQWW